MSTFSGRQLLESSKCSIHNPFFSKALQIDPTQLHGNTKITLFAQKLSPTFDLLLYNDKQDEYCERWTDFLLSAKSLMPWPRAIGRTMDPSWIDCRLLGRWIDFCDREHGSACKIFGKYSFASKKPTWLVDVRRQCVTKASNEHQYVALSYVWGTEDFLTSTRTNIQTLPVPGALFMESIKSKIPTTILDTMKLVHTLGFQYLWVDALCIVQDDSAQKHQDIANMPGIYANAVLTIIACQGTGAHHGLLGVDKASFPRECPPEPFAFGTELQLLLTPLDLWNDSARHERGTSKWRGRGWTLQEAIFSCRKLVFEKDTVGWQCPNAWWTEKIKEGTECNGGRFDQWDYDRLFGKRIVEMNRLCGLIDLFNMRKFTYPEDSLPAFNGMATVLSEALKGGFISGLPTVIFHAALLWAPCYGAHRRIAKTSRLACLPSWSWAGWDCPLNLESWVDSCQLLDPTDSGRLYLTETVVPSVHWNYQASLESPGVSIYSSWREYEIRYLDDASQRCPARWTRFPFTDLEASYLEYGLGLIPRCFYTHEENPEIRFKYPIPLPATEEVEKPMVMAPFISCVTRGGRLFYRSELQVKTVRESNFVPEYRKYEINDAMGGTVGFIIPNMDPDGDEWFGNPVDLIEVAQGYALDDPAAPDYGRKRLWQPDNEIDTTAEGPGDERISQDELYSIYHVMWISWEGEIAYREGVGIVKKSLWDQQELDTVHVTLG